MALAYPDIQMDLLKRYQLATEFTFDEADLNWDKIQDGFNAIRPLILALNTGMTLEEYIMSVAWKTGNTKFIFSNSEETGWLLCNHRTIGSSSSNSNLIGTVYQPLFEYLWVFAVNNVDILTSAGAPTTKGISAAVDFAGNKRIYLPDACGRVLVNSGSGARLTTRVLGTKFGAEFFTDNRTYSITNIAVNGNTPALSGPVVIDPFTPTGGLVMDPFTPTGDVIVDPFTPTGLVTVDPFTPTGVVAITLDPFTPTGAVSVTVDPFTPTGSINISGLTISSIGPPTINVDGITCVKIQGGIVEPGSDFIDCASDLTVSLNDIASGLDVAGSATFLGDLVSPTASGSFLGDEISPTGSAAFTGDEIIATASFVGDEVTPSASFVGILATLTGSFVGDEINAVGTASIDPTPLSGVMASGVTDPNPLDIATLPPSIVATLLIKI